MDVNTIRQNIRQIEQSLEGRFSHFPQIINASGNENFSVDGTVKSALTVTVISPFIMKFEAGVIEFSTSGGNLLGTFTNPNGALVRINNAINSTVVNSNGVAVPTAAENAAALFAKSIRGITFERLMQLIAAETVGSAHVVNGVQTFLGPDGTPEFNARSDGAGGRTNAIL